MRRRLVLALALGIVGAGVALWTIPPWGSQGARADVPETSAIDGMHAACEKGDVEAMMGAMASLTEEGWEAMHEHMHGSHDGSTGTGMMGMGSMMIGGLSATEEGWEGMHGHMHGDHDGFAGH